MVKAVRLLAIRWGDYRLAVMGPRRELWPPNASLTTYLRLSHTENISVEVHGKAQTIDGLSVELTRPVLHEDAVVDVYLEGPSTSSLHTRPRASTSELVHASQAVQHYRVRYRGSVGQVSWEWTTPLGTLQLGMEIFPSKVDYRTDYEAIRRELLDVAPQLTMSLSGHAGDTFSTAPQRRQTDVEWLEHIRAEHERLALAMQRLLPRLRAEVHRETRLLRSDRIGRAKPVSKRDYRFMKSLQRPRNVLAEVTSTTRQTPINGYLRWEIDQLFMAISQMKLQDWIGKADSTILAALDELGGNTGRWQAALSDIDPVPHPAALHTRLRDPQYAAVLNSLRKLRWSLAPNEHGSLVSVKDLPTLYEYWVYLTVVDRLRRLFPVEVGRTGSAVRRVGGELVLTPGSASRVVLRDHSGVTISCQYNRRFTGLPTTGQRPDSVIEVEGEQGMLVIDAKYRLGRDADYLARYGVAGPLEEDINVLHRYRDAIVRTQPPHRRLVAAGLIAFPSAASRHYRRHRFHRSWPAVWIGGVPMLPGSVDMLDEALDQFFLARTNISEGQSA